MAHGLVFIAFVVDGAAGRHGRSSGAAITWLLALLASIVPLGSVIFLIWADRTGRLGAATAVADRSAGRRSDVTNLLA